jgi:hypothetical protein
MLIHFLNRKELFNLRKMVLCWHNTMQNYLRHMFSLSAPPANEARLLWYLKLKWDDLFGEEAGKRCGCG